MKKKAIRPEVLPKETAIDLRAQQIAEIHRLQDGIEHHVQIFAEMVVRCGMLLLKLKNEVGYGRWEKYFRENIERPKFQSRHARNYMAVAKRVQENLAAKCPSLLVEGNVAGSDDTILPIRDALADMTNATTWHQLLIDFGLMRSVMPRGGDHGGGKARHELAKERHQIEVQHMREKWDVIVKTFREFALHEKGYLHVSPPVLAAGIESITECLRALPKE